MRPPSEGQLNASAEDPLKNPTASTAHLIRAGPGSLPARIE
jgi:hypothetical protein